MRGVLRGVVGMVFKGQRGEAVAMEGKISLRYPLEDYLLPLVPKPEEEAGRPAYVRFAALAEAPDEDIVKFASRFGLLGLRTRMVYKLREGDDGEADLLEFEGHPDLAEELRESRARSRTTAWKRALEQSTPPLVTEGEPILWWRREAKRLDRLIRISGMLREAEEGGLESDDVVQLRKMVCEVKGWGSQDLIPDLKFPEVVDFSRDAMSRRVNKVLTGPSRLEYVAKEGWRFSYKPTTLLEALYVQFIQGLVVGLEARFCKNPNCPHGGGFVPNDRRQLYCCKQCRWANNKRRQPKPKAFPVREEGAV